MRRDVTSWKVKEIFEKIRLNPATLETLPGTIIKVNIEYQRGIVYSSEKQAAIIESILKDFAIPSIVLWKNEDDGTYDVIDGKQRLTSIFLFKSGNLQIDYIGNKRYYSQISDDDKTKFEDYDVPFIIMSGSKSEEQYKHELFKILNTTAVKLNNWELLYGSYYGNFLDTFKAEVQNPNNVEIQSEFNFRDRSSPALARYDGCYKLLSIHFKKSKNAIEEYVSTHREDSGQQFYNKEIKSILAECSKLPNPSNVEIYYEIISEIMSNSEKYNNYIKKIDRIISRLKEFYAENVYTKINGYNLKTIIYNIFGLECEYVKLDPKRLFTSQDKEDLYSLYEQKGKLEGSKVRCPKCGKLFDYKDMHVDHIIPHKLGGRTTLENAQFMCSGCNPSKGAN